MPASNLSDSTFGLTMLIVGMGGTLVTLWLLTLLLKGLTTLFPVKEEPAATHSHPHQHHNP